ncbi:MAG: hypothetical protein ACTSYR_05230, partial [Candidatus Odinarchaeia archaeon]
IRSKILREKPQKAAIIQKYYPTINENSTIDPYFYVFLNEISNLYSYIIPKKDFIIIGSGNYDPKNPQQIHRTIEQFIKYLIKNTTITSRILKNKPLKTRLWYIPFNTPNLGVSNVLLTGDAAGLVNCFSGEGIRTAIESGYYAAEAIITAHNKKHSTPLENYTKTIQQMVDYTKKTKQFALNLNNNEKREKYIKEINIKKITPAI